MQLIISLVLAIGGAATALVAGFVYQSEVWAKPRASGILQGDIALFTQESKVVGLPVERVAVQVVNLQGVLSSRTIVSSRMVFKAPGTSLSISEN